MGAALAAAAPPPPPQGGPGTTTVVTLSLPLPQSWSSSSSSVRLDMAESGDVTRVIVASLLLTLLGQWLSHLFSSHALPAPLRKAYLGLRRAKRDEWNTRVWSSLHAILVSGCVGWTGWKMAGWEVDRTRTGRGLGHHPHPPTPTTTTTRLSLHARWAEAPGILEDTLHRSAEAPLAIAITTGYLLGDALLVAFSTLPQPTQRRWLGLGWEYGPISAPASTLAHHLVGMLSESVGAGCVWIDGVVFGLTKRAGIGCLAD